MPNDSKRFEEKLHLLNICENASWKADFDCARLSIENVKSSQSNEEPTLPHAGRSPFALHRCPGGPLSPTGELCKNNYSDVDCSTKLNSSLNKAERCGRDVQLTFGDAFTSLSPITHSHKTDKRTAATNCEVALTKAAKALEYSRIVSTESAKAQKDVSTAINDRVSLIHPPSVAREEFTSLMLRTYAECVGIPAASSVDFTNCDIYTRPRMAKRDPFHPELISSHRAIQLDLETVIMYTQVFLNLTAKDSSPLTRTLAPRLDVCTKAGDGGNSMIPIAGAIDKKIIEYEELEPTTQPSTTLSNKNYPEVPNDKESPTVDFQGVTVLGNLEDSMCKHREKTSTYPLHPCHAVDSGDLFDLCSDSDVKRCEAKMEQLNINGFAENQCGGCQDEVESGAEAASKQPDTAEEEGIGSRVVSALNLLESVCKVYAHRLCEFMKLPIGEPENKSAQEDAQILISLSEGTEQETPQVIEAAFEEAKQEALQIEKVSEEAEPVALSEDSLPVINIENKDETDYRTYECPVIEASCHDFKDPDFDEAHVEMNKIDSDIVEQPADFRPVSTNVAGKQENKEAGIQLCKEKSAAAKKHAFCSVFSSLHHNKHGYVQSLFGGAHSTPKHVIASGICNNAVVGINDGISPATTIATASTPMVSNEDSSIACRAEANAKSKDCDSAGKNSHTGRGRHFGSEEAEFTRERSRSRAVWSKLFHRNNSCKRSKDGAEIEANTPQINENRNIEYQTSTCVGTQLRYGDQSITRTERTEEKCERRGFMEPPKVTSSLVDICIDAVDTRTICGTGIDTSVLYSGTEILYKYNSKDGKKRSLYFWVKDGRLHWSNKKLNLPKTTPSADSFSTDYSAVDANTPKLQISKANTLVAPHLPPIPSRTRARNVALDESAKQNSRSRSTSRLPSVFRGMLGKRSSDATADGNSGKTTNSSSRSSSVFSRNNHFIELSDCRGIIHSYNHDIIKKGGGLDDNQVQNIMLIITNERQLHIQATNTHQFYNWFLGLEELILSSSCVLYKTPVHMRMSLSRLAFRRAKIISKYRKPNGNSLQLVPRQ